jgi:hypothetical protein
VGAWKFSELSEPTMDDDDEDDLDTDDTDDGHDDGELKTKRKLGRLLLRSALCQARQLRRGCRVRASAAW